MPVLRPLPPRPSLEFERKEAKALLRRLRAGDDEALQRALAYRLGASGSAPAHFRLADAQLVIAREYGFTSWPRLVQYYEAVERQRHNHRTIHSVEHCEFRVRSLLAHHRDRFGFAARTLASYVPRFYGRSADDVYASAVSEDEARLAVARESGASSWEDMVERAAWESVHRYDDAWQVDPMRHAADAMKDADLHALQQVIAANPELLHPTPYESAKGRNLMRTAFHFEETHGREAMRPIVEWLSAQGFDVQHELNVHLSRHMRMGTDAVLRLLERGADANWVSPAGIPLLEHALINCWNGDAVDLIAARTTPRKALWIAAGLGDVNGVAHFLDRAGNPTAAAYRMRPDFDAACWFPYPSIPDPSAEELLMEAFWIALINNRSSVMAYMVERGFNVNSVVLGTPVVFVAAGNAWTSQVECLVRCGADVTLTGWGTRQSARDIARELFETQRENSRYRRIVELCGLDPDAVLAERDARPAPQPMMSAEIAEAIREHLDRGL